jgi:hypothetical protein
VKFLVHAPESHFAEQHEAGVVRSVGEAVVCRFGDHICEVDSLAEHVPCYGCLGRGNSEPLTENAHEVGQPRPVPKQLLVIDVLPVPLVLGLLAQLVDVHDL